MHSIVYVTTSCFRYLTLDNLKLNWLVVRPKKREEGHGTLVSSLSELAPWAFATTLTYESLVLVGS